MMTNSMKYRVLINYKEFDFDEGEAALSFAEVASRHITEESEISIRFVEEEEDGR